ncbi:MAG: M16 family metallopeptidase [Janthinobacterium lividum]
MFNSTKLPSGLTVLTYNIPSLKSVAINLVVKVGSRYETAEESGISHFLEHMAFKGTSNRSSLNIAEEFDSIGGHFNAYTSKEQTVYYTKVLENNFYKAIEILADIIQNSLFSPKDIEHEFKVIMQEIAGVFDNPEELIYEQFYSTAFANQSLGRSILGRAENLAKFDTNSFHNFLAKHYNSDNLFISIAGDIKHQIAVDAVTKLFLPKIKSLDSTFQPAKYNGGYSFTDKKLEQASLILGFKSVPYTDLQKFYHAQILSLILGGSISSRLFQKVREKLGLAYSVGSFNSAYYDTGIFGVQAATSKERIPLLIETIIEEIENISSEVLDVELLRAKEQIKTSIYMSEEKSASKSEEIGRNFAILGKYYSSKEILQQILATTEVDILNVAKAIFSTKPTLCIIGGEKSKKSDYYALCKNLL